MPNLFDWLRRISIDPLPALLLDAYRPLTPFVGEALLAMEPLIPGLPLRRLGNLLIEESSMIEMDEQDGGRTWIS